MSQQALVLEAERDILGGVLLHPESFIDVRGDLCAEDFFRDAHQRIWRACERVAEKGQSPDWLTLQAALGAADLERVGGPAYLSSLTDGRGGGRLTTQVALVRNASTVRRLRKLAERIVAGTEDMTIDASEALQEAEQAIFAIGQRRGGGEFVSLADVIGQRLLPALEAIQQGTAVAGAVPTWFPALDRMTRGVLPGQFVLLAARPSMGKTSFAMNVAVNQAKAGVPVGVFSLEQSCDELGWRALFGEAKVNGHRILRGDIHDNDYPRLSMAIGQLQNAPVHINERGSLTVADVHTQARRLVAQEGVKVIWLDYLQLMRSSARGGRSRNEDVTEFSAGLKAVAKDLKVPVIALSQLSRNPEQRDDHRPRLSDLRDSGALEQDADMVWFLYREEVYRPDPSNDGHAELIVAKQRNGPLGSIDLAWHKEATRFEEVA